MHTFVVYRRWGYLQIPIRSYLSMLLIVDFLYLPILFANIGRLKLEMVLPKGIPCRALHNSATCLERKACCWRHKCASVVLWSAISQMIIEGGRLKHGKEGEANRRKFIGLIFAPRCFSLSLSLSETLESTGQTRRENRGQRHQVAGSQNNAVNWLWGCVSLQGTLSQPR